MVRSAWRLEYFFYKKYLYLPSRTGFDWRSWYLISWNSAEWCVTAAIYCTFNNSIYVNRIDLVSYKVENVLLLGPTLMNLSYVAELPTAGSNLSHRLKVKDKGFESVVGCSNSLNSVPGRYGVYVKVNQGNLYVLM